MIDKFVLVAGSQGNIGKCVTKALDRLGVGYITMDVSSSADLHPGSDFSYAKEKWFKDLSLVISCMPYHSNWPLAVSAIREDIPYCDLGGSVEDSADINAYAGGTYLSSSVKNPQPEFKDAPRQVFTDLGLAPGWVNIIAAHKVASSVKVPESVTMMVGGIPQDPDCNPLRYERTWSLDGLLNEYRDNCIILKDGIIQTVPGMSGLRRHETLESFYTSGGASHSIHAMKERGVLNCEYRTLRWKGHNELMCWLMKHLDSDGIDSLLEIPDKIEDVVLMSAYLDDDVQPGWGGFTRVYHDDEFSAMQKATAYPFVAAALLMDEMPKRPLNYFDIPYEKFDKIVNSLLTE